MTLTCPRPGPELDNKVRMAGNEETHLFRFVFVHNVLGQNRILCSEQEVLLGSENNWVTAGPRLFIISPIGGGGQCNAAHFTC